MRSLYRILSEENQKSQRYFRNYIFYAKEIKKILKQFFPEVRVIIFGSVVKGEYKPDSDIDILIISPDIPDSLFKQAEIKNKIEKQFPFAPFQFHFATPEEFKNWYTKFIKDDYIEV